MKKILWYVLALLLGILPGFFIVFNSVFSDSNGSIFERTITFLLVIVVFGVLGFLLGRTRQNPFMLALALSLFSILVLMMYLGKEPDSMTLVLVYLLVTFESAHSGARLGKKWGKAK